MFEPVSTLLAELLLGHLFVCLGVVLAQHVDPATIRSLVDEGAGTSLPERSSKGNTTRSIVLHIGEGAMLDDGGPLILRDVDLEELGHILHLALHISLEVVEVDEHDVGQILDGPQRFDVLPEGPKGFAVVLEPLLPEGQNIFRRTGDGIADKTRRFVEGGVPPLICGRPVIEETPDDISAVTGDVQVLGLGRKVERIDGQVGLEETAMGLSLNGGQLDFFWGDPQINPGGHLGDVDVGFAEEDHLGNNLLHPRGSCRDF